MSSLKLLVLPDELQIWKSVFFLTYAWLTNGGKEKLEFVPAFKSPKDVFILM